MIDSSLATNTTPLQCRRPKRRRRTPTRGTVRPTTTSGLHSVVRGAAYAARVGAYCGAAYTPPPARSDAASCYIPCGVVPRTPARPSAARHGLRPIVTYIPRGVVSSAAYCYARPTWRGPARSLLRCGPFARGNLRAGGAMTHRRPTHRNLTSRLSRRSSFAAADRRA